MVGISAPVAARQRTQEGKVARSGRAWALAGIAGTLLAMVVTWIVQFAIPMDVYEAGGSALLASIGEGNNEAIWRVSSGLGFVAVAALVPFAVGLRRHLAAGLGEESGVPGVVMASVLITAGILALSMSFRAQVFDGMNGYAADPASHVTVNRLAQDTVLAAWATLGIGSAAVAVAGFRSGCFPRWLTGFSAVVTGLVAFLCLGGVPFPANVPASLWLLSMAVWAAVSAGRTHEA